MIATRAERYTENAARDILNMLRDGETDVSGVSVAVTNFEQAKLIKLGKLSRVIYHVQSASRITYSRMPRRYSETVALWKTVIESIDRIRSEKECRRIAKL